MSRDPLSDAAPIGVQTEQSNVHAGKLQVEYYHQFERHLGNIMWPKSLGTSNKTHPVTSVGCDADSPLGKFRALGYFASCFPEGDGITMKDESGEKSANDVAEDIRRCFGWDVIIKRSD
jgi:hypothetical protein